MGLARYTLNRYSDDDEVIGTLESKGIKWGKFVAIFEKLENAGEEPTQAIMEDIMTMVFPKATHEELADCLFEDMVAVFMQIQRIGEANGLSKKVAKKAKN